MSFEANAGQTDAQVNYLARGSGYTLFLTPDETVLALQKPIPAGSPTAVAAPSTGDVLRLHLAGANVLSQPVGMEQQASVSNYYVGSDPSQWHTGIANYGKVEYQQVYDGVNLVYYGNQQQLEYDFVVAPGANPGVITLAVEGAKGMTLDSQGNLILHAAEGDVVEKAPVLYQESAGGRQSISGGYVLEGDGRVGFAVGVYDTSKPLVIDPILSYSSYLGGAGIDQGAGIAVDGAGEALVTGQTASINFPTTNPGQPNLRGTSDIFVTKFNANGTARLYSTYLGGTGDEIGGGIAVDGTGNAYVTGVTESIDFPTMNAFQPAAAAGGSDAFVARFNANGVLVYSSYLGGSKGNAGNGIAVDGAGNAYVTGNTDSIDFPTANAFQPARGGLITDTIGNAFVTRVNTNLAGAASLVYSTYLGGSTFADNGTGIAVDGAGNAYVTGSTDSTDFPTANAFQATL